MIADVLVNRLKDYAPANVLEQENVLQELMQQYVLASLSRAKFFARAGFHGGTCLRILHSMNRFSEDLDFVLKGAGFEVRVDSLSRTNSTGFRGGGYRAVGRWARRRAKCREKGFSQDRFHRAGFELGSAVHAPRLEEDSHQVRGRYESRLLAPRSKQDTSRFP